MSDTDADCGKGDSRQEVSGELVIAGGDATEVLEPGEHALDQVALAIGGLAVGDRPAPAGSRWNDGPGALIGQEPAKTIGVVGLVGDQALDGSCRRNQGRRHRNVVDVAGREQQDPWPAFAVRQRVDFRGAATARAADGFAEGPPFPPAAVRCALIWELSMAALAMMPGEPV